MCATGEPDAICSLVGMSELVDWCLVFGWSLGELRGQLVSREQHIRINALIVKCVHNPVPPFLGQARAPSAFSKMGPSCCICPSSVPPDQLSQCQWARDVCNLPWPIIMVSLCSLWKGGSDGVLV